MKLWLPLTGLALVVPLGAGALTASTGIPPTALGTQAVAVTADQLTPPECAGMTLTSVVVGTAAVGTPGSDLVLGTSGADQLAGGDGDDCLVGGEGDDILDGDLGTDVCIGGAGTNQHRQCEAGDGPGYGGGNGGGGGGNGNGGGGGGNGNGGGKP